MRKTCTILGVTGMLFLLGGCATTSKRDITEDTNTKVNKLVDQLAPAVDNLNQTATELNAKVDATDQTTRKLQTNVEEMQAQLDSMKKDVKTIQKVVYQQNNLSMPGGTSTMVDVEPPAGAAAPASAPAPAGDADGATLEPISAPAPAAAAPAATPAPVESASGNPKEMYQQAQDRFTKEDYKGAVSMFGDFLAKYPGDEYAANAQFWKAKSQLRLDQYQDAIGEFLKVQQNYPSSTKVPFALHNAAVAYNKLGRNDDAAKLLQQVIDKYPISPAADQARRDLKQIQGQ